MPLETVIDHDLSIIKLIMDRYSSAEEVPYLEAGSSIRASSLATLCPREEVLCSRLKRTRKREIPANLQIIFDHGHALHDVLQNNILPGIGVMRGKWSCVACNTMQGGPPPENAPISSWAVARPEACEKCGETRFRFHEVKLRNEKYRLTGHSDGFLELPPMSGLGIVEGKSIGKDGYLIQNVPKLEHVLQLQTYLWLTDLKWGVIFYWMKAEYGMASFVEHFVERDEDTIEAIKDALQSIWDGVDGGALPARICATDDCPRAGMCSSSKECFAEDDGPKVEDAAF